jgi:hypothetical protein
MSDDNWEMEFRTLTDYERGLIADRKQKERDRYKAHRLAVRQQRKALKVNKRKPKNRADIGLQMSLFDAGLEFDD